MLSAMIVCAKAVALDVVKSYHVGVAIDNPKRKGEVAKGRIIAPATTLKPVPVITRRSVTIASPVNALFLSINRSV